MKSVKGLILCGGKSSRMGQDKTTVNFRGKSFLAHTTSLMESLGIDYYLSINASQKHLCGKYNGIEDRYGDKGPLGGIASALRELQCDLLVIPIDMPELSKAMLRSLLEAYLEVQKLSAYTFNDQIQPFPSLWPISCLPSTEEALSKGKLSVRQLVKDLDNHLVHYELGNFPRNLNSPSDLS